ncbi:MAG: hypothetical protein ACTSX9_08155, partial [Candidatus Njordarchaeales archaeon]
PTQYSLSSIEIEVLVTKGVQQRADVVMIWDWFGAWEPASEIQYLSMQVNYRIQSSGLDKLGIVSLPTINYDPEKYRYVYFFYDTRYPTWWIGTADKDYDGDNSITAWDTVYVFYQALQEALTKMGFIVSWVNADELRTIMSSRTDIVVVIASGVVPDTIYDPSSGNYLIRDWLRGGGILVWAGDWIGYNQGHSDGTRTIIGMSGDEKVLGADVIGWGLSRYYANYTELGYYLNLPDISSYYMRSVIKEWYEQNEGGDIIILYYWKVVQYIGGTSSSGAPSGAYIAIFGWTRFGDGYALVFPKGYGMDNYATVEDAIARAFLVMPRCRNAFSYEYYNPEYINGDVLSIDNWEDTVMPEEETTIDGYGENFADISDWQASGGSSSIETDGDIATIYSGTTIGGGAITGEPSHNLASYPFLEIRAYVSSGTYGVDVFINDGTQTLIIKDVVIIKATSWTIYRVNLYELVKEKISQYSKLVLETIRFRDWSSGHYLYVDWIRLFNVKNAVYYSPRGSPIASKTYWYCDYGVLTGHIEASDWSWDWIQFDITDFNVTGKYLEIRVRAGDDDSENDFAISAETSVGWKYIICDRDVPSSWTVIRVDLESVLGKVIMRNIRIAVLGSDNDDIYVDYIKIGSKGSWRPIYEAPLGKVYNNPARIISDSITIDKLRFSETLDHGVLNIKIGVLTIAWGIESVSGDLIVETAYYESQKLTIIHTYSMYYALRIENIANPYRTEDFILPITALITSVFLTLRKSDRERVIVIRLLGIVIAVLLIIL